MTVRFQTTPPTAAPPAGALRDCLGHFATGVTVVTYDHPDGPRGLTVNSFTSVSLDPALVLVCIDRRASAAEPLRRAPFAVNVLRADQHAVAAHFAGMTDMRPAWTWTRDDDVPCLGDSMARLICRPWSSHAAGDHRIVIGRVVSFDAGPGAPLCFFRGRFATLGADAA